MHYGALSMYALRECFTSHGAGRKAAEAKTDVKFLEDRLDRMTLLTTAMWTLVQEKVGVTEEELAARIEELDLSDGKRDGKINVKAQPCEGCGRKVSPRHFRCMYCGRERPNPLPM